ncbi:MAG: ATP-binding protein, partial [Lysobacterales bacterium]
PQIYASLWLGVQLLALFNFLLILRQRLVPASADRVSLGLVVDLLGCAWMVFWTGGTANPFITLLLLPVALTASVMSPWRVIAFAAISLVLYAVLVTLARPLPELPGRDLVALHEAGTWLTFVLALTLLTTFALRLATRLKRQRAVLAVIAEREQRQRTLLSLALQAAGTAHEINTPLATMATLVDELLHEKQKDPALHRDLQLLAQQIDHCRDSIASLRTSVRGESQPPIAMDQWLRQLVARWCIIRPEARIEFIIDPEVCSVTLVPELSLTQTILNLLDNALDATREADSDRLQLFVHWRNGGLEFEVRDFGAGFEDQESLADSRKRGGLGLGLMLSRTCVEAMGGSLSIRRAVEGGSIASLRIPGSALRGVAA